MTVSDFALAIASVAGAILQIVVVPRTFHRAFWPLSIRFPLLLGWSLAIVVPVPMLIALHNRNAVTGFLFMEGIGTLFFYGLAMAMSELGRQLSHNGGGGNSRRQQ